MSHRALPLALAALLAAGCDGPAPTAPGVPAPRASAVTYHEQLRFEANTVFANPCVGEDILAAGKFHYEFHFFEDPSGGYHAQGMSNVAGVQGTGLVTGEQYEIIFTTVGQENFSEVVDGDFENAIRQEFSFVQNLLVISQGDLPNYQGLVRFHVTFDENGEPIVEMEHVFGGCRGRDATPPPTE